MRLDPKYNFKYNRIDSRNCSYSDHSMYVRSPLEPATIFRYVLQITIGISYYLRTTYIYVVKRKSTVQTGLPNPRNFAISL